MVIESYWKQQAHDEESCQNRLVVGSNKHQPNDAGDQDDEFGHHHISKDRPNKESLLTFEKRPANWAVMLYAKRPVDYARLTAGRTAQPQRAR